MNDFDFNFFEEPLLEPLGKTAMDEPMSEMDLLFLYTCEKGDVEALEKLLYGSIYLNINVKNLEDKSGLMICTEKNYVDCVKLLLSNKNTLVNYQDVLGNSALHIAIINKNMEITQLLLKDWRININSSNSNMETTLHLLAKWCEPSLVLLVTQHKNLEVNLLDIHDQSALDLCIDKYIQEPTPNKLECIYILLNVPTIKIHKIHMHKDLIYLFINHPNFNINSYIDTNDTILTYSCRNGDKQLFEIAIGNPKININQPCRDTTTAIDITLQNYNTDFFMKLIDREDIIVDTITIKHILNYCLLNETKLLILNTLLNRNKINKIDLLYCAIICNQLDIIRAFIDTSINLDTFLFYSLEINVSIFCYFLNNYLININCIDKQGNSLLHICVTRKYYVIAKKLIENNIDITIRNLDGFTALDQAVYSKQKDFIDLLYPISNISLATQIDLLKMMDKPLEYMKINWCEYYGNYLENMPDDVFNLLLTILTKKKQSINKIQFIECFNIQMKFEEYLNILDTITLDLCHNKTDLGTLELLQNIRKKDLILYGIPLDGRYRTMCMETIIQHTKNTGYGYLKDVLDPFDRSQLCRKRVYPSNIPIYIEVLFRKMIL